MNVKMELKIIAALIVLGILLYILNINYGLAIIMASIAYGFIVVTINKIGGGPKAKPDKKYKTQSLGWYAEHPEECTRRDTPRA